MKRSIFKKTLAVVLSLMMVLGTLAALPMGVGAEAAAWDGSTTTQPAGAGTAADPYVIASGANLAWLSANAASLTADVTYLTFSADVNLGNKDFNPIAAPKAVNIAGNGKTISGLKVTGVADAGLFSILYGGEITDLHFANSTIDASSAKESCAGLLAGKVKNTVTITACTSDSASTVTGNLAGGFVGMTVKNGPVVLTFDKCVNRASVEGTIDGGGSPYAGGLLARQHSGTQVTFTYCVNTGAVTGHAVPSGVSTLIGGLLAESRYVAGNTDKTTFENCFNLGTLTVIMDNGDTTPNVVMGGIVGWQRTKTFTMTNCYDYSIRNLGGADGTSNNALVGGGTDSESDKHLADAYAVNHPESVNLYANIVNPAILVTEANIKTSKNFDNASNVALSLEAAITVGDGESSSVLKEINKIAVVALGEPVFEDTSAEVEAQYTYEWYSEEGGTEADPYEIATADDWAGFVSMTNGLDGQAITSFDGKYVKLTADIDMAGYELLPANAMKKAMVINLDGAGHTISNLTQADFTSAGLFTFVSAGSSISNLTLKDCNLSAKGQAAAFVAETNGSISFLNCKAKGTVAGEVYVGGFVAYNSFAAEEAAHDMVFDACVNEANLSVTSTTYAYIGGFFGFGEGVPNINVTFTYCANKGNLYMTSPCGGSSIGGFVGSISYDYELTHNTMLYVYDSYNVGNLIAEMTGASDVDKTVYMGGIIGWARFGGEIYMERVFDYSARQGALSVGYTRNGALVGEAADTENFKTFLYCFAMNKAGTASAFEKIFAASTAANTDDETSLVLETLTDEIYDEDGNETTLTDEMGQVDALLATVDPVTGEYDAENGGSTGGDNTGDDNTGDDNTGDDNTGDDNTGDDNTGDDNTGDDNTGDTNTGDTNTGDTNTGDTNTGDTNTGNTNTGNTNTGNTNTGNTNTGATDSEDEIPSAGCGSSIGATFAVLALTTACGMAFVGKKKED